MDDFERGVRFVLEHAEMYKRGVGDPVTQFGDYELTMEARPAASLTKGSAEQRERRVQAMLHVAPIGRMPKPE